MSKNKSKSETKREAIQNGESVETAVENSEKNEGGKKDKKSEKKSVKPVDVKYRVTFLTNQMFKGLYRPKDTSMVVPEHVAKAYGKRTTLKFEPLKK